MGFNSFKCTAPGIPETLWCESGGHRLTILLLVVGCLELRWWDITDRAEQPLVVIPVHPLQRRVLYLVEILPWPSRPWRCRKSRRCCRRMIRCRPRPVARCIELTDIDFPTRQPTIMRENTSITKATYTGPRQVATNLISATHNRLGAVAVDVRSTRSAGRSAPRSATVIL